ncbi:hypothetical protein APY03_7582 [Variovorax sp. WDL1]|nr:hypothetical protein APY03_7582 [Variovorax sp. WDL1]
MRPAPHQVRAEVLQPRQFDLQLAFVRARALREDLEDQEGAVVHSHTELALEVALLRGAQCLVEDHLAGAVQIGQLADLLGLAAADEQGRIGRSALGDQARDWGKARGLREETEFLELAVEMGQPEIDADEDDGTVFPGIQFRQAESIGKSAAGEPPRSVHSGRSAVVLGCREVDGPTRHDGRDGMLVDHLSHRIAKQHDVLIERLDLPLQLDAVDQIDRNRHVLSTQGIQKGVL